MGTTVVHWFMGHMPEDADREDQAALLAAVESHLSVHALEPSLAPFTSDVGGMRGAPKLDGSLFIRGNFAEVSGAFCVETNDDDMRERLLALVRRNQRTSAYQAARIANERRAAERREREMRPRALDGAR